MAASTDYCEHISIVCPSVTVGDNSVIRPGAVGIRDIPANVLAVGNPARVLREI